jgi:hypothetical protein
MLAAPLAAPTPSTSDGLTNVEMVAEMAGGGYARDFQCFLRGNRTSAPNDKLWVALKEGHNAVANYGKEGCIDMRFAFDENLRCTHATPRTKAFFEQENEEWPPFVVWMKRLSTKRWHLMGKYTLGPIRKEHHNTTKRGKPHHTTVARRATRVGA